MAGTMNSLALDTPEIWAHLAALGGMILVQEESYDFEIWHVFLSYRKNMIGTLKKNLIPPLHPPL